MTYKRFDELSQKARVIAWEQCGKGGKDYKLAVMRIFGELVVRETLEVAEVDAENAEIYFGIRNIQNAAQ